MLNYSLPDRGKIEWIDILFHLIIFMFLPPVVGLPFIISSVWKYNERYTYHRYLVYMMCIAAYIGAINSTKMIGGDQWQYYAAYKNVPDVGFIGSLIWIYGLDINNGLEDISGEFMNGVYNYLGYYITFGYYPLFAFLYTFAEYMLMFVGLYKFCKTLEEPHKPFVCGVIILAFFYLLFQYTLQIQKQFMAQAIMMFVLGSYAEKGRMTKKLWLITIYSVFTHASTWLFVPFLIYKRLYGRMNKRALLLLISAFVAAVFYGPRMVSQFDTASLGAAGYGLDRLGDSETHNDVEGFALVWSQIVVIALPMAWIVFKRLWVDRKYHIESPQAFILNIVMLLLLTIVAMVNQPMAQYRYFMMLIAFMPFIYPLFSSNISKRDSILFLISIFMIGWFYVQYKHIIWHYAPEIDIVVKSPVILVFTNYWNI